MNEEDFIAKELIEVEIEGRKFKLKELSGPEYDEITNKSVKIEVETENLIVNLAERNKNLLGYCIIEAPYELNGKKFSELKIEEKIELTSKLKAKIRISLIRKINEINSADGDVKKNLKTQ